MTDMKTQHSWNPRTSLQRPRGESSRETEEKEPKHAIGPIPDHRTLLTYKHTVATGRECIIIITTTSIIIIIITSIIIIIIFFFFFIFFFFLFFFIIITVITIIRTPASACTTELVSRVYSRVGFRVSTEAPSKNGSNLHKISWNGDVVHLEISN